MENTELHRVPRDVERCFGFLYDRGFCLRGVEHAEWLTGNWTVIFESRGMLVYVSNNDSRITLELSSNDPSMSNRRFPIERLISILSDGRDITVPVRNSMVGGKRKQMERLASLLQRYFDQLTAYFASAAS